jgi:hypothetical protein
VEEPAALAGVVDAVESSVDEESPAVAGSVMNGGAEGAAGGTIRAIGAVEPSETVRRAAGDAKECQSKVVSEVTGSRVWIVNPEASMSSRVKRNPSARAESPTGVAVTMGW